MTVHCMGNGRVCVYGRGATVFQAFGPEYSSPQAFCVVPDGDGWKTAKLSRIAYKHVSEQSVTRDLIPQDADLFIRAISGKCAFTVSFENGHVSPTPYENTVISITKPGAPTYVYEFEDGRPNAYTSGKFRYTALRYSGDIAAETVSNSVIRFTVNGKALLAFAFSLTPRGVFRQLDTADAYSAALYDETDPRLYPGRDMTVAADHPYYKEICEGYDVIAAQQSERGSVLAGYNYHLSYVRDNYGVFRFFLACGAFSRAKAMLEYYIGVFRENGRIQNAQGMMEYAFHVHDNDDVEITGYLVLMFTSYYKATKDRETLTAGVPLIIYCLEAQSGSMTRGMLTFNGDETYIAGGFLPRSAINDGSAEATALYHKAINEALETVGDIIPAKLSDRIKADGDEIEKCYKERFFGDDGTFYCNCPESGYAPDVRPGGPLLCGHGLGMGFRNKNGDYVCPDCLKKDIPPLFPGLYGRRFTTEAALLCPAFTGVTLIPGEILKKTGESVLASLPSRERCVGYEYGMAMYAAGYDRRSAGRMLSQRDEFGAWSEYYDRGAQSGTLCRPWETAVNLAALIETQNHES